MRFDPDFVITVDGNDVSEKVSEWTLSDVEEGMSNLKVTVENSDGSNSCEVGGKIKIRFGYVGDLSDEVEMDIRMVEEKYSVKAVSVVVITGYDCTWKLNGKNVRGKVQGDTKKGINDILDANNLKGDIKLKSTHRGDGKNQTKKEQKISLTSKDCYSAICHLMNRSAVEA